MFTYKNISLYQNLKQPAEAIQYFKNSIEIYKNIYGENYSGVN